MLFSHLVSYFGRLEGTSKRLEMFSILADLLKEAEPSEIDKIVYLLQGDLLPPFHGLNLGMSEKYLLRVISKSTQIDLPTITEAYQRIGDIGKTAEQYAVAHGENRGGGLTVEAVYQAAYALAKMSGEGSVDQKIDTLATLFSSLSATEAKYAARFIAGKLRLGVGDATLLEALALSRGDRAYRAALDRAYNRISDMGLLAKTFCQSGLPGVEAIAIRLGYPIRPALCERLASPEEITEKIGRCFVEVKYDGFRCQAHKRRDGGVTLFSRNQEQITAMFPEIVNAIKTVFTDSEIIVEGEALAFNEATGETFPFQVTLQRKRKHDVDTMTQTIPLKFFLFDLLYWNGVDYTAYAYADRRAQLISLLPKHPTLEIAKAIEVDDSKILSTFFNETVEQGYEGIVAKRSDSPYTAGARNFNWIKLKRSYKGEMTDSLDLCIVGYYSGKGHRTQFGIGTVLVAAYDPSEGRFKTVSKIGTGFSEDELVLLKTVLAEVRSADKPADVDSDIVPDVWVLPKYIVTVRSDEITRSQNHTAGRDADGVGYALRFPRVVGFIRSDKGPHDTTTTHEIVSLFNLQKRVKLE